MGWPVMIFAAGFGTRMKHLTRDQPKPLIRVAGQALIDRTLALCRGIDTNICVINLHYKADMLSAHLDAIHDQSSLRIEMVTEMPEILDTGGGLRNALPLLGKDPVMTLNSDAIWCGPNPLQLAEEVWDPDRMDGLLVCVPPDHAIGYSGPGNFIPDAKGRVARGDGLVYGGVQIIKTARLQEIPEIAFSLNRLWDLMIADRRLHALAYPGKWCDVGHPDGVSLAEDLLQAPDV